MRLKVNGKTVRGKLRRQRGKKENKSTDVKKNTEMESILLSNETRTQN